MPTAYLSSIPPGRDRTGRGTFFLTVDVEEWFHTKWFNLHEIGYSDESPPRTRVADNVRAICDVLAKCHLPATFFMLVETCKRYPSIVDMALSSHVEIAVHGFTHRGYPELGADKFREEIKAAKMYFEDASGAEIIGYRAPNLSIHPKVFNILIDLGFLYDSSLNPCISIPGWYGSPSSPTRPFWFESPSGDRRRIAEFPHSVLPFFRLPGNGGWFLRNLGSHYCKSVMLLSEAMERYALLYVHPWEVSTERPASREISPHVFRNCGPKTLANVERLAVALSQRLTPLSIGTYVKTEVNR